MTYTHLMEKIQEMGAEFRIVPQVGYIQVKLVKGDKVLRESNIGW